MLRRREKRKDAPVIGVIGAPDEETVAMLEKELGKPVKKIEKKGKVILIIGKGIFKKKIEVPLR